MKTGNRQQSQSNPEAVREALFAAVEKQEWQSLALLCQQYQALISAHFQQWTRIPEHVRDDPAAVNRWAQGLITIAQVFDSLGLPTLMAVLTGGGAENPVVRWQDSFTEAQHLYETGHAEDSRALLLKVLNEMEGASGSFIDDYRPKIYGLLGASHLRLGALEEAQHFTELALRDCQRTGDQQGIGIYRENLKSIQAAFDRQAGGELVRIRENIAEAQDLSDALHYGASNQLLHKLLDPQSAANIQGYQPKIYGLLGSNYFQLEEMDKAREYTELAIQASHAEEDRDGLRIYQANLKIISRTDENTP